MPQLLEGLVNNAPAMLGQIYNIGQQKNLNYKTRQWNENMYARQRADALADRDWQTSYDSPAAQMARLRSAGLNPNLVYDNGRGAAGAAADTRGSSTGSWSPHAPQLDIGNLGQMVPTIYELENKAAQTDNLKQQNLVLQREQQLKLAQTIATMTGVGLTGIRTKSEEFDLAMKGMLQDFNLEAAELKNRKLAADTQMTLDSNERAAAMQEYKIGEAVGRIVLMRAQAGKIPFDIAEIRARIGKIKTEIENNRLDIRLKEKGIFPNSPWWLKIVSSLSDNISSEDYKGTPFESSEVEDKIRNFLLGRGFKK